MAMWHSVQFSDVTNTPVCAVASYV